MSKTNTFENDWMKLVFQATAIATLADDAATGPVTSLYVSLHTSDPGEAADQGTNESAYTSYARVAVARTNTGWAVANNVASPIANVDFPQATETGPAITHFGVGLVATATGGKLLYSGTVTPNITINDGVTPRLTTGTTVTED